MFLKLILGKQKNFKCNNSTDNLNRFITLRSTYRHELIAYKSLYRFLLEYYIEFTYIEFTYYNNKLLTFIQEKLSKSHTSYYTKILKPILTISHLPEDLSNYFISKIIDIF